MSMIVVCRCLVLALCHCCLKGNRKRILLTKTSAPTIIVNDYVVEDGLKVELKVEHLL